MKNFKNAAGVGFEVAEEWLDGIKISATKDVAEQVYEAAITDPAKSLIKTDDDGINKMLEDMKAVVEKAKGINTENRGAGVRVVISRNDGEKYAVLFKGCVYSDKLSVAEADKAIDDIKAYLQHHNMVLVRIIAADGKTPIRRAMELEAFVNKRAHKVISVSDNGEEYTVMYIPKGWNDGGDGEDDEEDEDEGTF
jgi:hypothetical protein